MRLLFQIPRTPFVDVVLIIAVSVGMVLVDAIIFKIGLKITKAETRNGLKWILISLGIQIGVILAVVAPIFLSGMSTGFGSDFLGYAIPFGFLALFMDWNVINVIHQVGMKRSFVLLIFMIIPLALFGVLLSGLILSSRLF